MEDKRSVTLDIWWSKQICKELEGSDKVFVKRRFEDACTFVCRHFHKVVRHRLLIDWYATISELAELWAREFLVDNHLYTIGGGQFVVEGLKHTYVDTRKVECSMWIFRRPEWAAVPSADARKILHRYESFSSSAFFDDGSQLLLDSLCHPMCDKPTPGCIVEYGVAMC